MDKKDNLNKLKTVISSIEKSYGKGSIMMLGKKDEDMGNVDVYSTGSLGLDIALGIGGLPKGRVVEVYGPESSGKTTLTLHVIAEAQKVGGTCAFIDAEHALDPGYAKKLGVAAIRDAAGVKATRKPLMMLVVCPVGFTKGSYEFAQSSGVILLAVKDIIDIAEDRTDILKFKS